MKIHNVNIIKKHEALRLKAYKPTPNDVWTIGYGHTRGVKPGMVITEAQAEQFLKEDLAWVERSIAQNVRVPLNQNQYDALASLIFNIGAGGFQGSSVLRHLNEKNYQAAADSFLKWNKQRNLKTGKLEVLNGLTKRREEERKLFLTPVQKSSTGAVSGAVGGLVAATGGAVAQGVDLTLAALIGAVVALLIFYLMKRKK